MARRKLLMSVEKLLQGLLADAEDPPLDDAGRPSISFGDRLRLAEVVTSFEVRRSKIEEDSVTSELGYMMQDFHHVGIAPSSRRRRTPAPEAVGAANGTAVPALDGPDASRGPADPEP
jgi:hypothetical protein